MSENWEQKNTNLTRGDVALADRMMREDGIDNFSAFVRSLIRKEGRARYGNLANKVLVFDQEEVQA